MTLCDGEYMQVNTDRLSLATHSFALFTEVRVRVIERAGRRPRFGPGVPWLRLGYHPESNRTAQRAHDTLLLSYAIVTGFSLFCCDQFLHKSLLLQVIQIPSHPQQNPSLLPVYHFDRRFSHASQGSMN
jgi:hypothetical protein